MVLRLLRICLGSEFICHCRLKQRIGTSKTKNLLIPYRTLPSNTNEFVMLMCVIAAERILPVVDTDNLSNTLIGDAHFIPANLTDGSYAFHNANTAVFDLMVVAEHRVLPLYALDMEDRSQGVFIVS